MTSEQIAPIDAATPSCYDKWVYAMSNSHIPVELRALRRWLVWRSETRKNGKPTKVPYQPNHPTIPAASTRPEGWASYEEAATALSQAVPPFEGLGFVLGDGITGVDLDGCVDPETREITPWAQEIIERLDSYTELSPSGRGVHILLRGVVPKPYKRNHVEVYSTARYFTVTGKRLRNRGIEERGDVLSEWAAALPTEAIDKAPGPCALPTARVPLRIGERLQRLVEQGWTEGCGFPSASELDFAIASEMLRAGHSEGEVVWVFTSPLFGFSRGKHNRPDYIQRTLTAAKAGLPSVQQSLKPLRFHTLEDAAREDWPLPIPIVDRLLFPNSMTLIAGPPRVGKTFFVMQLLASIASGRPFLDEFVTGEPQRCLHFTAETPDAYYWERWRTHFDPMFASCRGMIGFSTEKGLRIADDYLRIAQLIEQNHPKVVVFDTWIRYHGVDEKDNSEMEAALTHLDRLIEHYDVSVLVVHHTKKALSSEISGVDEAMNLIRGAGDLRAHSNANLVMLPTRESSDKHGIRTVKVWTEWNFGPPLSGPISLRVSEGGMFERDIQVGMDIWPVILAALQSAPKNEIDMLLLDQRLARGGRAFPGSVKRAVDAGLPPEVAVIERAGKLALVYTGATMMETTNG